MANNSDGAGEQKVNRAISQRWVDFKKSALDYDDDDLMNDYGEFEFESSPPPVHSVPVVPAQIPGSWNTPPVNPGEDASHTKRLSGLEEESAAVDKEDYEDQDLRQNPSTPDTYTASIQTFRKPSELYVNVGSVRYPTGSEETSLDSAVAGHEYTGLNRLSYLSSKPLTNSHEEEAASVSETQPSSSAGVHNIDPNEFEQSNVSNLRIANATEQDTEFEHTPDVVRPYTSYVEYSGPGSLGAANIADSDEDRHDSFDSRSYRPQSQYSIPSEAIYNSQDEEQDIIGDEHIQRNLQNLSLSRPIDSSVSSSEASSFVDRPDSASLQSGHNDHSDQPYSFGSSSLRPDESTGYSSLYPEDSLRSHGRSTSADSNKSESELMTETLLQSLQAQRALDSKLQSIVSDRSPTLDSTQSPSVPRNVYEPDVQQHSMDRPPIPIITPAENLEDISEEHQQGRVEDEFSPNTRRSLSDDNLSAAESFQSADDNGKNVEEEMDEDAQAVPFTNYILAPPMLPVWNFSTMMNEPNTIKRTNLFKESQRVESNYDSGLQSWLAYMTEFRHDVFALPVAPVGDSKGNQNTLHRTTSLIGHSVSSFTNRHVLNTRAGERSVDMLERMGEKSKGIFHKFGSKMDRECGKSQPTTVSTSIPFKKMHPIFKESYISAIKNENRFRSIAVYMVDTQTPSPSSYGTLGQGGSPRNSTNSVVVHPQGPASPVSAQTHQIDLKSGEELATQPSASIGHESDDNDSTERSSSRTLSHERRVTDDYVANFDYDVTAFLSAYENTYHSAQPVSAIHPVAPREPESSLFMFPKIRSGSHANISGMRSASFATGHAQQANIRTPHRVVTAPIEGEANEDLARYGTITKSFLKQLSVLDSIGNFEDSKSTSSDAYTAVKAGSEPEVQPNLASISQANQQPDSNVSTIPKSISAKTIARKPLGQSKGSTQLFDLLNKQENEQNENDDSQKPVLKYGPSFELGIPNLRVEGEPSKYDALPKLKCPEPSSSKIVSDRVPPVKTTKDQSGDLSRPVAVEELRNFAKRKPVPTTTSKPVTDTAVGSKGQLEQQDKPLPRVPVSQELHVAPQDTIAKESNSSKQSEVKTLFRDLMQMDAMGVTPATRAQIPGHKNHGKDSAAHSGSKAIKLNLRTLKGRFHRRNDALEADNPSKSSLKTSQETSVLSEQSKPVIVEPTNTGRTSQSSDEGLGAASEEIVEEENSTQAHVTQTYTSSGPVTQNALVLELNYEPHQSMMNEDMTPEPDTLGPDEHETGSRSDPAVAEVTDLLASTSAHLETERSHIKVESSTSSISVSNSLQDLVRSYDVHLEEYGFQDSEATPQVHLAEQTISEPIESHEEAEDKYKASNPVFERRDSDVEYESTQSSDHSDVFVDVPDEGSHFHATEPDKRRRRRSSMPDWSPITDFTLEELRLPSAMVDRAAAPQKSRLVPPYSGHRHQKTRSDPQLILGSSDFLEEEIEISVTAHEAAGRHEHAVLEPMVAYAQERQGLRSNATGFSRRPVYDRPHGRAIADPRTQPMPRYNRDPFGAPPHWPRDGRLRPTAQRPLQQGSPRYGNYGPQRPRPSRVSDDADFTMTSERPPTWQLDFSPPRKMGQPPRAYREGPYRPQTPDLQRAHYDGPYPPTDYRLAIPDYRSQLDFQSRTPNSQRRGQGSQTPDRHRGPLYYDEYSLDYSPPKRQGHDLPYRTSPNISVKSGSSSSRSITPTHGLGGYPAPVAAASSENMPRKSTTPDFDLGALGTPKRYPKRHI